MPLVRVHEASDGKLFKSYDDFVIHQEGINFQQAWKKAFDEDYFTDEQAEANFKLFVEQNTDVLVKIIESSKVKHQGGRKKK